MPTQLKKRFVIWSDEFGVYLGNGYFSLKQCLKQEGLGVKPASAPTYSSENDAKGCIGIQPNFPDWRLIEVHPSIEGQRASVEDCANALLPRW